jgi:hypothetical protein
MGRFTQRRCRNYIDGVAQKECKAPDEWLLAIYLPEDPQTNRAYI